MLIGGLDLFSILGNIKVLKQLYQSHDCVCLLAFISLQY